MHASAERTAPARKAERRNDRGFSLIELMMVVVIVATLAKIAIPNYQTVKKKADAAAVIGDFEVVKVAVFQYQADNNTWPADANRGKIPPGLENYLPEGFSFDRERYLLDFENWMLPDGTPSKPSTQTLLGVSLVTDDTQLGQEVLNLIGDAVAKYTVGDHYTYIFLGT